MQNPSAHGARDESVDGDAASPPPYVDGLQEFIEAIALGERANQGRFCGNCYALLDEQTRRKAGQSLINDCAVCGASPDKTPPVECVPAEVLSMYLAKRNREGLIVNIFAFVGIFLSLVLSATLWFVLPDNWWRALPFIVLAFGSYYLARVIGYNVGVPIGSRSGRKLRDRRWVAFEKARNSTTTTASSQ